jgi:hypothetical protein
MNVDENQLARIQEQLAITFNSLEQVITVLTSTVPQLCQSKSSSLNIIATLQLYKYAEQKSEALAQATQSYTQKL